MAYFSRLYICMPSSSCRVTSEVHSAVSQFPKEGCKSCFGRRLSPTAEETPISMLPRNDWARLLGWVSGRMIIKPLIGSEREMLSVMQLLTCKTDMYFWRTPYLITTTVLSRI